MPKVSELKRYTIDQLLEMRKGCKKTKEYNQITHYLWYQRNKYKLAAKRAGIPLD